MLNASGKRHLVDTRRLDPLGGRVNLKGSFLVPLAASLEVAGLKLTPAVANARVRSAAFHIEYGAEQVAQALAKKVGHRRGKVVAACQSMRKS